MPLFEFVIKAALAGNDLETAEGRVAALRSAAPVVAGIRDGALRPEYARRLAGWLGIEVERVREAVAAAGKARRSASSVGAGGAQARAGGVPIDARDASALNPKDPVVRAERMALEVLLQEPASVEPEWAATLDAEAFTVPQYRAVWDGIVAAGGIQAAASLGVGWVNRVADEVGEAVAPVVSALAVSPMSHDRPAEMPRYARSVIAGVHDLALTRKIGDVRGRMQRIGEGGEGYQEVFAELVALEGERRELREE